MEVKYTPAPCRPVTLESGEKVAPLFEGSVVVKVPTFDEKFQYLEDLGFEVDEKGQVNVAALMKPATIRKIVATSKPHYVKVEIKRKSDGKEFKSFDDLSYHPDCDGILMDVAMNVITGGVAAVGNG